MSAEKLYTPDLLAAAVELAGYPLLEAAQVSGAARSPTCGSTLDITLLCDSKGRVERIGMRVRACAVGQASAAVFARHAMGRDLDQLHAAHDAIADWLAGEGAQPAWPDLDLIAPARDFRGRHGAILLPWKAAIAALSSTAGAS